jgi:ATP-dependent DNA helicase RecQ
VDAHLVAAAVRFLRDQDVTLPPRRQWPAGAAVATRTIPETRRAEPGRALGEATDAGWGPLLADLLTSDQPLPHPVVEGLARLLGRWGWAQPPSWVTFVPSRTRPTLVRDLADHAARLFGVPVHAVVQRVRPDARPQAELANSFHQYRNAHDAFTITGMVPRAWCCWSTTSAGRAGPSPPSPGYCATPAPSTRWRCCRAGRLRPVPVRA